jgi:zinc protease
MIADPTLPHSDEIPALPPGVRIKELENGLTVIVKEDHSAPVVSAQAWCRTGSIDEGKWLGAGMSHMLEHMLFKGTTTRGAGRIDQEVQDAGGYMNAYTSFDRTVYWINVPSTGGRVAIDVLCDIVQNATLPEEELEKEKQVIRREMDMNQDDPARRASRRLFETAFIKSPYRFTIIGYPDIFNELSREDVYNYYRERYIPNNAFFVVVGDVKAAEVFAQVQQAFSGAKARALPPSSLPQEPAQTAPRELIEEAPIQLGHFHLSWHIPDIRHPDVPLLDVLATLLGNGRSARLYQEIREKRALVNSVDAWIYSPGDPGLFGMSAVVNPEKFQPARDAMLNEVERLKRDLVPAEELSKVVKQFISSTLAARKTMQGQAQDFGSSWMAAHDLNFTERYLAAVKRATPADLQRVARQYFTSANRTMYALLPEGTAPSVSEEQEALQTHEIQKFEFSNGLRLLVKEDHRLPFVEMRAVFRGGVLAETADTNGLTQLVARMLMQGTESRSAEQIASEIESIGGSIDTFGGNNSFGISAEVLSTDFQIGLDLVADVILHPSLPAAAFQRERQIQLAGVRAQQDQMLQSAGRAMRQALFGAESYGLDALGTEESLRALNVSDLDHYHRRLATPNNCVLAIFGDVDAELVRRAVEKALGSWPAGNGFEPKNSGLILGEVKRVIETRDKKQAVLLLGFQGARLEDEDRFALELLQEACSDLGSRLFVRIREELGLAYYVGAQNFLGLMPGYFAFYVGTAPGKVELVERELLQEAELLRSQGLTPEELQRAKAKLLGQKKIARQDLGTSAITCALDELYGLGYDFSEKEDAACEAVTAQEIKRVAQKYLRKEAFVIAVVQPDPNSTPESEENSAED